MGNDEEAIVTEDLRKTFGSRGGPVEAVRGVTLSVGAGQIFGLLGPNGAGKTTTLRMLTTLLPIDSGARGSRGSRSRRTRSRSANGSGT